MDPHLAEINWIAEAEQWLMNIYNYIAQDDAHAAARVVFGKSNIAL